MFVAADWTIVGTALKDVLVFNLSVRQEYVGWVVIELLFF